MKTAPIEVTLVNSCGDDLSVVNAARVSFAKESSVLGSKDAKLIAYLAEHKHTSPFNHAFLSFRVKAPIFVARQLVKHKFMPWNEVSRRYVDDEPEFFFPEVWRSRSADKKQGSAEEHPQNTAWSVCVEGVVDEQWQTYKDMINNLINYNPVFKVKRTPLSIKV